MSLIEVIVCLAVGGAYVGYLVKVFLKPQEEMTDEEVENNKHR